MSHLVSLAQGAFPCCGDLLCSPARRKVTGLYSQTMSNQASIATARMWQSMPMKTIDNGDLTLKNQEYGLKRKEKLTAMLRKSEKSVVLLLQQDHP